MTVILTGFEPFGGDSVNPTAMLVRDLDGAILQGVPIRALLIPVSVQGIHKVASDLQSCVESDTILIGTGLANGRSGLSIERVAINCCDFPIPDNDGTVWIDKPIVTGGREAYFSTLPIKRITKAWQDAGIEGRVSNTAGTYLCNAWFYLLCSLCEGKGARAGFIHVPYIPEMVTGSEPSLPYDILRRGVEIAIQTAVSYREDLPLPGGAIC